ncbi:MAG: ribosome recycling factor [Gammaproteobacteria bacterium]|jgi:ribosome recycling factor|nr:ribosome recycling factor [Gammaproteobacteria bacterium]MDX2458639.1 ribosome recycling factor [Gammaproteobacteria bacterium]
MIEEIKSDTATRMNKSVEALKHEFSKLRTGRAQASLLDHVSVSYYGTDTPLNQVASVVVSDARTLTVTPWEKKIVPDVEKAILHSDLGLNPVSAGDVIRVPLPALTEERRKEMTKVVRHEGENARVAIRNIRRDANQHLKGLIKEEHLAKDDEHRAEDEVQKLTDKFIATVDELLKAKEQDLMEF